ncbi:hypothetical protein [Clostridium ihumii]|uniref:hypothetical protein n=1 Tax=Clostridium ihumii TaxID=1470356 RepID=UPI000559920C|nr:hypothetical protein [Clostridium ihumii]
MIVRSILLTVDLIALVHCNNKRLEYKNISEYQLRIGYRNNLILKQPILVDMRVTPHIFVCGLSGNGKTKMIEYALRDKKVVLINVFEDDLKNINTSRRINGNDNILKYFNNLLKSIKRHEIPLYLVIDEMLVLCMDKAITKVIMDVLAVGRHYNIYIIGIAQIGTKESIKFKDLFNARVCFRQVEESSYRTVLGYSPENTKLKKREFYYYSDNVGRGKTYTI